MASMFHVSLEKLIQELNLHALHLPCEASQIRIVSNEINRTGLLFTGFYDYFDEHRIQLVGKSEFAYLLSMSPEQRQKSLETFFAHHPQVVIFTSSAEVPDFVVALARANGVALLSTEERTSDLLASLIATLNLELAPRITRHGVLVEIYGEGVLLLGESGVGKSETAIELIKRGHRLIADDAVEIRRVSSRTLVGSSPENIRHFIELRGIGIINARRLFGMGAIKVTEKIDMVVMLESWERTKVYDRMGLDSEYTDILGIKVPSYTIPIKPGRNLAIILEVAAMNNRQKKMGYNAAQELLERLGMLDGPKDSEQKGTDWEVF